MINLEFSEEEFFLDINWYFADRYNRLCVVASGGGVLPKFLFDQENQNDEFHKVVSELPERFEIGRNENILELIRDLESDDLNQYFRDFDSLAKKGFYVYDKVNLSNSQETEYLLVAFPIYNSQTDVYPINLDELDKIPKIATRIVLRTNTTFSRENFRIIDLVTLLDNQRK